MQRRAFLASGAALAARPAAAATAPREDRVSFVGDGISLNPIEYSRLLARVVEEKNIQPDSYALGGAIQIESPVRRKQGELFDFQTMQNVCALAREKQIGLHLDGARIFLASAYTGIAPARYANLFDTVYVSLYKYFNAASGAILAGPKRLLDGLYNTRRQFGGGLAHAWPLAAVALHYLDGFEDRFGAAVAASERLFKQLEASGRFRVARIQPGSNIARLRLQKGDPAAFRAGLAEKAIAVAAPDPAGAI